MTSWFQNQLKRAEELLEVVDRTAKNVADIRERDALLSSTSSDLQKSHSASTLEKLKGSIPSAPITSSSLEINHSKSKEGNISNKEESSSPTSSSPSPSSSSSPSTLNSNPNLKQKSISSNSSNQIKSNVISQSNVIQQSNESDKTNESIQSTEFEDPSQSQNQPAVTSSSIDIPGDPTADMEDSNDVNVSKNADSSSTNTSEAQTATHVDSEISNLTVDLEKVAVLSQPAFQNHDEKEKEEEEDKEYSESNTSMESNQIKIKTEDQIHGNEEKVGEETVIRENKMGMNVLSLVEREKLKKFLSSESTAVVQEELEEAKELLQVSVSEGKSREARLARVCASLKTRVQEYRSENSELEKLLLIEVNEKVNLKSMIQNLNEKLSLEKSKNEQFEQNMGESIESKNSEIKNLLSLLKEAKKKENELEEKLISVKNNSDEIFKYKEFSEAKMIQALREELILFENRYEEEKKLHSETRLLFSAREYELEQKDAERISEFSKLRKLLDEKTQKICDVEEKVLLLEQECASLNQEIQILENQKQKNENKKNLEDHSSTVQAWKKEAERVRALQTETENKLFESQALIQKLRVELEAKKREMEEYPNQAHEELEKRYRELTELLYSKQSQLEAASSEKQSAIFQLEKERRKSAEMRKKLEQDKVLRRSHITGFDEDGNDLNSLESLTLKQRRLGPSIQKAAKLLDHGTMTAGRFLWRHPLARLALVFYLVFLHFSLMFVLHRFQQQADEFLSHAHMEDQSELVKPIRRHFF